MRYFFVSDIHGEYDELIAALEQSGFDMNKDTIVSLGDPFDRGFESKEVLDYLLQCPHHIFIIGNHDWRLKELMISPVRFTKYDISNGINTTLVSFLEISGSIMAWDALRRLSSNEALHRYFDECNYYIEFKDLIGVHGWIPYNKNKNKYEPFSIYDENGKLDTDWHHASGIDWYDATWAQTENLIRDNVFPNKKMIIGHWHAWRLAEYVAKTERMQKGKALDDCPYIDCSIYEDDKIIAIDGCTNWPNGGKVNVYIYETDEKPHLEPVKEYL